MFSQAWQKSVVCMADPGRNRVSQRRSVSQYSDFQTSSPPIEVKNLRHEAQLRNIQIFLGLGIGLYKHGGLAKGLSTSQWWLEITRYCS